MHQKRRITFTFLFLLSALAPAQMRIISHVTRVDGGFTTQVIVANTTGETQAFNLMPYSEAGQPGSVFTGNVLAGETLWFDIADLFSEHPGYFFIDSEPGVQISTSYQHITTDSPAHVRESSELANLWRIYPGDWETVWDGLALVHRGDEDGRVVITQIGADGTPLEEDVIADDLPSGSKVLYNIRAAFVDRPDTYYRIQSSQPISVTSLRGSLDFTYLWENTATTVGVIEQATYRVTFEASWSAGTHPDDFPSNAHFSPLIGATHNRDVSFWAEGASASGGIEQMAETGATSILTSEIVDAIATGGADISLDGAGINSPGSTSFIFTIVKTHPLVTLVTMIAPSPDWFLGVHDLCLYQADGWVDNMTIDLYPYDAGTDSGETYTSPNNDSQPQQFIYRLIDEPFQIDYRVTPLGTFTLERLQ